MSPKQHDRGNKPHGDTLLGGSWVWACSRLRVVIGMSLCLVLSMERHTAAQANSASAAPAAPPNEADKLDEQGEEHYQAGQYDAALTLHQKALQMRQKSLGKHHPRVAESLNDLALVYLAQGSYKRALPLFERSLAIREQTVGKHHPDTAQSLHSLGKLHAHKGDYARALVLYERSLAIREHALGKHHPDVAESLNNLALLYKTQGDYERALPLYERSWAIMKAALGARHPRVVEVMNNLALLHSTKGDYQRALPLYERALAIQKNVLGEHHPQTAVLLNNLAELYKAQGNYEAALPLYEQSLAIRERSLGRHHPDVARVLNNMGVLCDDQGDYKRALALHKRALAIREQALDAHHRDIAQSLNNLAETYKAQGNHEQALALLVRALAILEHALGKHHPWVAAVLNNLAGLHYHKGDYEPVLPLYARALAIAKETLGAQHPNVAIALNNLAKVHRDQGNHDRALALFTQAAAIWQQAVGKHHPYVAMALDSLGMLHVVNGDYERALPLLQQALAIMEKTLDKQHPDVAISLKNLALLHWAQGNDGQAITYLRRAMNAREAHIRLVSSGYLARAKRLLLTQYSDDIDAVISFALQAPKPPAKRLALATLLARKGRVSDSMSNAFAAVRRRLGSEEQKLLDEYRSNRTIYARQLLRGPKRLSRAQHQKNLDQLQQRAQELEQRIAQRSKEPNRQLRPVTIDAVQSVMPATSVLVEWMRYRTYDPKAASDKRLGSERYAASVLAKTGDPVWIDLGAAAPIDNAIKQWRSALARRLVTTDALARKLDVLVMAPVRAHLGTATNLFLAPDGPLNLVPFAALVDEHGRHLVERYLFTYLTSGRDLLRIADYKAAKAQSPALIVADPQYEVPEMPAVWTIEPLPKVMAEARLVHARFPDATLLSGNQATEQALKKVRGPVIVHLATHGYFLPMTCGEIDAEMDDPRLHSGVALAGASACHSPGDSDEDGLLTALEAASLDLYGTELAVLSACDTGIGGTELHDDFLGKNIGRGDGVQGLRQALVVAGAKTQMVSLWPVGNATTRKLMAAFYHKLAQGQGRSEALRRVQLEFLQHRELAHPNAWAAFIISGESGPLNLPMAAKAPGTHRGPRGCACAVMATEAPDWPGSLLLVLFTPGLLWRLRRQSWLCFGIRCHQVANK